MNVNEVDGADRLDAPPPSMLAITGEARTLPRDQERQRSLTVMVVAPSTARPRHVTHDRSIAASRERVVLVHT